MIKFFTIGVFGSTEDDLFQKLINNNINTFCDIRQRRGVRGSKYRFVNSIRLQQRLRELNIRYIHIKDLAPSKEIRDLQRKTDYQKSETKKTRDRLGKAFKDAYNEKILNLFDLNKFLDCLIQDGAKNTALFCVEEKSFACHRSIVSNKLKELGFKVKHL